MIMMRHWILLWLVWSKIMSCIVFFRLAMNRNVLKKTIIMRNAGAFLVEWRSRWCAQRATLNAPPPNKMGGKSLKRYILHFFGAFFAVLATPVFAASGFLVNGVCAINSESALAAFSTNYPTVTATSITTFVNSIFLPQWGQIQGNLVVTDRLTGIATTTWQVFQLDACSSPVSQLGDFPIQDVVFVFACVIIWGMGIQSGMHR